jgi:hypothetical protein
MTLHQEISHIKYLLKEQPESVTDKRFGIKQPDVKPTNDNIDINSDNVVDLISGALDVIPGIGNLLSAGIDIVHALTYIMRYYFSKSDDDKIKNLVSAFITFGTTLLPVGGNVVNITSKQAINTLLKKTPKEILIIGNKLGIYKGTMIFLQKGKWKYSFLLLAVKIFQTNLSNLFNDIIVKIDKILKNIKRKSIIEIKIYESLIGFKKLLSDLKSDIKTAELLSKNLNY